jgi:hypothetical protein
MLSIIVTLSINDTHNYNTQYYSIWCHAKLRVIMPRVVMLCVVVLDVMAPLLGLLTRNKIC